MKRTAKIIPITIKGGLLQNPPKDCPWKDMGGKVVDVTLCEFFCNNTRYCEKYDLLQQYLKASRRRRHEMHEMKALRKEEENNV